MAGIFGKLAASGRRLRSGGRTDAATAAMQRLLADRPVRTVFDIGANQGSFSEEALASFDPERVFAFEPIGEHYRHLCAKWPAGGRVTPVQMAMGNSVGPVSFNINANPSYNHSLLARDDRSDGWATVEHVSVEQVEGGTVDSFCEAKGIDHLSILKIDAEGADLMVLQGAERMLGRHMVDIVYTEVLLKPLFDGQGNLRQFLELMERHGYVFFNIFDTRTNNLGQLTLANPMFVTPEVLDPGRKRMARGPLNP